MSTKCKPAKIADEMALSRHLLNLIVTVVTAIAVSIITQNCTGLLTDPSLAHCATRVECERATGTAGAATAPYKTAENDRETHKMHLLCKKVGEKFGGFTKSLYLCTRNSEIKGSPL